MQRQLPALMFCMLAAVSVQAQQARCADANGVGRPCSGEEAISYQQAMQSGKPIKRNEFKFELNAPNNEGRDMFARPADHGLSHDSMQQRLEKMDAAAAAARASQQPPVQRP